MKTPNKGDLVILREKRWGLKRDALHLAQVEIYHNGGFVAKVLSDGRMLGGWPEHDRHTIEEVLPLEKLPNLVTKPEPGRFVSASEWKKYEKFCMREAEVSLYPLEVGDEVKIYKYDRVTRLYSEEPGMVTNVNGHIATIRSLGLGANFYSVCRATGLEDGCISHPAYVHITRKHKPKQEMCNNKFKYKIGQKFFTSSGIKFEVVSVAGDIAYAKRISEPMWLTRIEYRDGSHVCVDDRCVLFTPIDTPPVAETKKLVSELYRSPELIERADGWKLESINTCLRSIVK